MPTQLSPLEETLFQAWARAHRVEDHNDPNNQFDYRNVYKQTNGRIHPPGMIAEMGAAHNAAMDNQGEAPMDPMMAQVEQHKAMVEADSKARSDQIKREMNKENNLVKIMIKKMELEHKSQQLHEDRAHKSQMAQQDLAMQAQQSQQDRLMQAHQSDQDRIHQASEAERGRQQSMREAALKGELMKRQLKAKSNASHVG